VNTPAQDLALRNPRFGLMPRSGVIAAVLTAETLIVSYFVQATPVDSIAGAARILREVQHWGFRFFIAYAMSLVMLAYLRGPRLLSAISDLVLTVTVRTQWLLAHGLFFVSFVWLCLAGSLDSTNLISSALAWHALALGTALSLCAAFAPLSIWFQALRLTGALSLYALLPAAAAVAAIQASQLLWGPTAALTFRLVALMLAPICPAFFADSATLTLYTQNFAVTVSEICSGLEGVGLMLIFCTSWLWYFRREYSFPRALIILPLAVLLIFLLNSVRIAALVLIGTAGYPGIATMGFHSQAGWIAFNLTALGVAVLAKRSTWLHRRAAAQPAVKPDTAVAAYLMPLLGILGAGMIAHALSAGFDVLYPLRLVVALAFLWTYRESYRSLDWGVSWRGALVGTVLFLLWIAFAHFLQGPAAEPPALLNMPSGERIAWLSCRVLAAVVTVPIAEELAYRGFLMRRWVSADFTAVSFGGVPWPALLLTALAFGLTHGSLWLPGVLAGLAYGGLAIKTGKLGEAALAHGTTNALLAAYVLLFDQWQLW
jgi:exosortase E/protease (VPEID-CTERM system)